MSARPRCTSSGQFQAILTISATHTYYLTGEGDTLDVLAHNCPVGRRGAFAGAKRIIGVPRTRQPDGVLRGYYNKASNWRRDGRTYFFGKKTITEHRGEPGQLPHFHPGREGGDPHIFFTPK